MGRASRGKKLRREEHAALGVDYTYREQRRFGKGAEAFGRTVGSSLTDYEAVGLRGEDWLAAALISRHNQRMERVGHVHPRLVGRARILVNHLFFVDRFLRNLGANPKRPPVSPYGEWPDHLAWGLDSAVQAIRLVLAGQFVGAAVIARSQLERWALNVAHDAKAAQLTDEPTSAYYDRLWAALEPTTASFIVPEDKRPSSTEVKLVTTGEHARPGLLFDAISEFLHGRGPGVAAAQAEACDLLERRSQQASLEIGQQVLDLVELSVDRVRNCVCTALLQAGEQKDSTWLFAVTRMHDPAGNYPYPPWSLWPFDPRTGLSPGAVEQLRRGAGLMEAVRRGERPAGRHYRDDEMSNLFFLDRRAASAELALRAFEHEAELNGEPLDMRGLYGRQRDVIFAAEILALLSKWDNRKEPSAAAAVASSALRTALWLWLEDDNRAMAALRVVLESLARLRAWNIRPGRAERLEARGSATNTVRWLYEAGWKRLRPFNKALGELAHSRTDSRWMGAWQLLVALQPPGGKPEQAPLTGRGYALDSVVSLAVKTALEGVGELSSSLAQNLADLMSATRTYDEEVDRRLEEWLDRTLAQEAFNFGKPDFTAPAVDSGSSSRETT